MSISLNNHESRIKVLESKINTATGGGITEVNSSANGYVKFGNGIIINWGTISLANERTRWATFAKPFTTTNYRVVSQKTSADHNNNTPMKITGKETGRFAMYSWGVYAADYIAIGILYTYRYIIKSAQKFTPLSYLFNKEV